MNEGLHEATVFLDKAAEVIVLAWLEVHPNEDMPESLAVIVQKIDDLIEDINEEKE